MTKDFKAYNHGTGKIDLSHHQEKMIEMKPTEIHLKENGSRVDKETFTIVMEHPMTQTAYGQISLEMLNNALGDIGYKLIKL